MEKQKNNFNNKKNKKRILIITLALLVLAIAVLVFFYIKENVLWSNTPTVTVVTPGKQSISQKEIFTVDVSLSELGNVLYPAASLSISFDAARLEFMGVEEGNVMILDDVKADGRAANLPDWSVNVARSNEIGQINVMYLDMTGGKYAFTKDLLAKDDNILMRLSFRLRGSAKAGDIYELNIMDAAFAASDDNKSLTSIDSTLRVRNGRIVVED